MREYTCTMCGNHCKHIGIRGKLPTRCGPCNAKLRHMYYEQRKVRLHGQRGNDVQEQQDRSTEGNDDSEELS